MTSSPNRTPPPDAPDEELEDERSYIRTRREPLPGEQRAMAQSPGGGDRSGRSRPRMPSESSGAADERVARVDRKIRIAQILLDELPPTAPRARLLRAAIVRRDEVLLDGILESLDERANAESITPPTGDPATGVQKRRDGD